MAEAVLVAGLDTSNPAARRDERVVSIVRDRLLSALGRGLDFTGEDLAANRTGMLTAREQQRLRTSASFSFGCAIFCALVGVAVSASLARDSVVAVAAIGGVTLLVAGALVGARMRGRRDAAAQRVALGVGRLLLESGRGEMRDLVVEDGTSFSVSLRAFSSSAAISRLAWPVFPTASTTLRTRPRS